jgi:ferredoxin
MIEATTQFGEFVGLQVVPHAGVTRLELGDTVELAVLSDGVRTARTGAVVLVEPRRVTILAPALDPEHEELFSVGTACSFEVAANRPWASNPLDGPTVLVSDEAGVCWAIAAASEYAAREHSVALQWIHSGDTRVPLEAVPGLEAAVNDGTINLRLGKARRGAAVNERTLGVRCPDWNDRIAVVVGSAPTTAKAIEVWESHGRLPALFVHTVAAPNRSARTDKVVDTATVTAESTGRQFDVAGDEVLLDSLEAQGVELESGCRRGICHTCSVTLETGCVTNVVDGSTSGDGTKVRLCVSRPQSDLTLGI